jgi:superfamily II DNA or RNA helicase
MANGNTMELELRPFQAAAVQSLRVGLKESFLRQMLYSPTGSGKSVMATGLIKGARLKNKRVAFLVNRVQLVEQMSAVLRRYGIPHGVIQGENTRREYEHVLVCSIQTVAKRGLPDVDFIVIDEAHAVAGSKDYRGIIETFAGKPVIGLSASPFSKGLGKHYDSLSGPLSSAL